MWKNIIYILDDQLSVFGQMEIQQGQRICQLQDGRVVVSDKEISIASIKTVLREVDFTTGGWGETYTFPGDSLHGLYPAGKNDPYDIYLNDGSYLFGYNLATGDRFQILNWLDTGVELRFLQHLLFLGDERIYLIINQGNIISGFNTKLINLIRTAKDDLPEVEIITLGGFDIKNNPDVGQHVQVFNFLNRHQYRIELIDYRDYIAFNDDGSHYINELRFLTDLVTGRAPDILYYSIPFFMETAKQGLFLDLFTLIDNDPELSRSDFFPSILSAISAPDRSLPAVDNTFSITTMIGMPDMVGGIQSWTFTEMLKFIEQTEDPDIPLILFENMLADRFMDMVFRYSSRDIIDWDNKKAYLDSSNFIDLLEVAYRLPRNLPDAYDLWETWGFLNTGIDSSLTRLLRGEQMFELIHLFGPEYYMMYTGMLGDDIVALGMPTQDGGAHSIMMYAGYAISASSKNQTVAWEFVRSILSREAIQIPETRMDTYLGYFPLRIDLFDDWITYYKTPVFIIDGNEVEASFGGIGIFDDMVWLYTMTDAEEMGLRKIIENASIINHFDATILSILNEELPQFLAGNRSAADTARVLQNRVQTYLNERG